jgi:hypothetical protein
MHSKPGSGEFVSGERFGLARLVEVLVHAVVGLHLGRLLLQVVGSVRVDLHFPLALLGLAGVVFEVDADELPLLFLFGYLVGSQRFHFLRRGMADLAAVSQLCLVAFGFDEVGGGSFVPEFKLEIEALAFLRAAVGVFAGYEFLLSVVVLEVDHCHFLEPSELLLLAAMTAEAAAVRLFMLAQELIGLELGFLVSNVDGLSDFPFFLGEGGGLFGLAGLFGAGLGGVGLVGVVARPLVLFSRFALEKVKRLVHPFILSPGC